MKTLILTLVFTLAAAAAPICAQTVDNDRIAGKKLNSLEQRFRKNSTDQLATAKKRAAFVQDALDACLAAESYPWKESDLVDRRKDVETYQKKLAEAQEQFDKNEALLAAAITDKKVRKQLNKELKNAFLLEKVDAYYKEQQRESNYPTYYPTARTFRVHCHSGGYGRYFWVRCTSSSY